MRFLVWLWRAFLFICLFAFSLNNQHTVSVNWFFGYAWTAPMIFIILAAFALGTLTGVLAMTPRWWQQWRLARRVLAGVQAKPAAEPAPLHPPTAPDTPHVDGI